MPIVYGGWVLLALAAFYEQDIELMRWWALYSAALLGGGIGYYKHSSDQDNDPAHQEMRAAAARWFMFEETMKQRPDECPWCRTPKSH
jgi:hypothetical protein